MLPVSTVLMWTSSVLLLTSTRSTKMASLVSQLQRPSTFIVTNLRLVHISYRYYRPNAPWGLQRISQNPAIGGTDTALVYNYKYDNVTAPVDIFVIDTGINSQHVRALINFS